MLWWCVTDASGKMVEGTVSASKEDSQMKFMEIKAGESEGVHMSNNGLGKLPPGEIYVRTSDDGLGQLPSGVNVTELVERLVKLEEKVLKLEGSSEKFEEDRANHGVYRELRVDWAVGKPPEDGTPLLAVYQGQILFVRFDVKDKIWVCRDVEGDVFELCSPEFEHWSRL